MAKIDKIKEEIGWLKVLFSLSIIIDVSLIGWIVQSYQSAELWEIVLCVPGILVILGIIMWTNKVAYYKMDILEEL